MLPFKISLTNGREARESGLRPEALVEGAAVPEASCERVHSPEADLRLAVRAPLPRLNHPYRGRRLRTGFRANLDCGRGAQTDEDRTLSRLRGLRSNLIDPAIAAHHGRIVSTVDGSIIEFRSVVGAARVPALLLSVWQPNTENQNEPDNHRDDADSCADTRSDRKGLFCQNDQR